MLQHGAWFGGECDGAPMRPASAAVGVAVFVDREPHDGLHAADHDPTPAAPSPWWCKGG